jgi:hypothetical protein
MQAVLAEFERDEPLPCFPEKDMTVFFIVGYGKSGTTWLVNTLNTHPEILCKGEGRFFERHFVRVVPPEDLQGERLKSIQPTSLYGALSTAESLGQWIERSVWTEDGDVERHMLRLARLSTNYFLAQALQKSGKKIVGDKTTISGSEILVEIAAAYPEAKVIHPVRDGRDVAVSMIHHMWNYSKDEGAFYDLPPEDLKRRDAYRENPSSAQTVGLFTEDRLRSIAGAWRDEVQTALRHSPRFGENYTEVRYEDLLEKPREELGRVLRFLGADADEGVVAGCVEANSFERWSQGRERGREESTSFFRKGVAGDWRNVFTEEDKRVFKEVAGKTLIELGYETDEDW